MKTAIWTSTVESRNTGRTTHPFDPAEPGSKLKGREIGSGLILGMEETGAIDEPAIGLICEFSGSIIRVKEV